MNIKTIKIFRLKVFPQICQNFIHNNFNKWTYEIAIVFCCCWYPLSPTLYIIVWEYFPRAINNLAQIYLIISSAIQLPNGIVIIVSTYQIKSNFVMQKSKKDCLKKEEFK